MEIKHLFIELFLVVTLINQVSAETDTIKLSNGDEGQKLYEELFIRQDDKYNSLTPDRVMKKLERLVAIFNGDSYGVGESVYEPENKKKVMDVYNVVTEFNCDQKAIEKFNGLLRSLSIYGNLSSALKLFRDERFIQCKAEYPKKLYKAVNEIGPDKKRKVSALRDEILTNLIQFNDDIPFYTPEAFDKGVLAYLASNPGVYREKWEKDKMISEPELATLYENEVVSMCSSLGDAFYKETEFFLKVVATDSTLARMNDSEARFWMINSYICQDAIERRQQIVENMHNIMMKLVKTNSRACLNLKAFEMRLKEKLRTTIENYGRMNRT